MITRPMLCHATLGLLLAACSTSKLTGSSKAQAVKTQDATSSSDPSSAPSPAAPVTAGTSVEQPDSPASTGDSGTATSAGVVNDAGTTAATNAAGTASTLQVFAIPGNPTIPVAKLPFYGNSFTNLYSIDPKTGASTMIGKFTLAGKAAPDITDIAINTAGSMFAISGNTVYAVDPTTGALTVALTHSVAGAYGLTFLTDGTLIIAGDGVSAIKPKTKETQVLVAAGLFGGTSGDIIALPDNKLYWSVFAKDSANDDLIQIDPAANYATKRLGSIGVAKVFGLGYAGGQLLGLAFGGSMFPISTTTGAAGADITTKAPAFAGASSNPAAK